MISEFVNLDVVSWNKMKNKKYLTAGTVPNSNRNIVKPETKSIPLAYAFLAWCRHMK
jgi:hypothetical protein